MLRFRMLIVITLLEVGCTPKLWRAGGEPPSQVEPMEYAVYSAVLDSEFFSQRGRSTHATQYVIGATTWYSESGPLSVDSFSPIRGGPRILSAETLRDFGTRNRKHYPLSRSFRLTLDYYLIEDRELAEIFGERKGAWGRFYARYPNARGLVRVSRVGFNRERSQALVAVESRLDALAGRGYAVLLRNDGGGWVVQRYVQTWLS